MNVFEVITLFPQAFPGTLDLSILKKSRGTLWDLVVHDLRTYGIGKHRAVDDAVFGGLPGMLIRPDVIDKAMQAISFSGKKIFLSPRGRRLNQLYVEELAKQDRILFLCGRYEGVDQRAIEHFEFEEVSIGDYILAGAEVAALAMIEAIVRKIPGVLSNELSFSKETFSDGKISEPRYTRPAIWNTIDGKSISVEEVLLSGHHGNIELFQKNGRKDIT